MPSLSQHCHPPQTSVTFFVCSKKPKDGRCEEERWLNNGSCATVYRKGKGRERLLVWKEAFVQFNGDARFRGEVAMATTWTMMMTMSKSMATSTVGVMNLTAEGAMKMVTIIWWR